MGVNCLIFFGNTDSKRRQVSCGPYRIATELRNHGFTAQVIDLSQYRTFNKFYQAVLRKFVDKETLWIGFSVNFMDFVLDYPHATTHAKLEYLKSQDSNLGKELEQFIRYAKELNPQIQFISGGSRIIDLKHLGFYEFRGYADQSIIKFTQNLSRGLVPHKQIYDYDTYDRFAQSQIQYQKHDILNHYKTLAVEISRGCVFRCKFCAFPLNGKTKGEWIKRSEILREEFLRNYENYGITDYAFADDTFNDTPQKVETLYNDVFSKLPFKISFSTYLRLDLLHRFPHTLDILKESGLKSTFFGIETLNPTAAKIIGKGWDPMKQIEFVEKIKSNEFKNITLMAGWILGLPTDTMASIEKMVTWLSSENNPLDRNGINRLYVNSPNIPFYRIFTSPFEQNLYQYNLEIYLDDKKDTHWRYKDSDLNSEMVEPVLAQAKSQEYQRGLDRKLPLFNYSDYLTLGVSNQDVFALTERQIKNKYDLTKLQKQSNENYAKNLLNL